MKKDLDCVYKPAIGCLFQVAFLLALNICMLSKSLCQWETKTASELATYSLKMAIYLALVLDGF